jgi:hypothetical protein
MRGRADLHSIVHQACDRPARSSIVVSPLQSSFATIAARALSRRAACLGSRPSSRHHRGASTVSAGSQPRAPFRPQAITASRRFAPRSGSEACCILEPRSGPIPLRGFSLHAARAARRRPSAPVPSAPTPSWRPHGPHCQAGAPRLRGLAPRGAAFVPARREPDRSPLPSPGSISSGSIDPRPSPGSPGRSAHDVARSGLRLRARRSSPSPASWRPRGETVLSPETVHPHELSSLPIRNLP